MDKSKLALGVALVAVVLAIGGYLFPHMVPGAGGVTNYDELDATAIKIGGTNGTRLGPIITTTCNLSASAGASGHAATTSKEYFCAVTGVVAGDTIFVSLPVGAGNNPNGSSSILGGFSTNGIGYATTTGIVAVQLINLTGTATSSFAQATTSAAVTVLHTRTSVPGL